MRLGRDYTNCLMLDYLDDERKKSVESGDLDLGSANVFALEKAKSDVERQIEVTRELGMNHVELDSDSPDPYLEFDAARRREIRETAESNDVTLSLHLPYSYVGQSLCCLQESDRKIAVELDKQCLKFASDIGAKYAVTHPGTAPFYQTVGKYREFMREALVKSLVELGKLASESGVMLHLENNVAFDNLFIEVDECIDAIRLVRDQGIDLYFNFDIGHWFTRADIGKEIPNPPEKIMETLPDELLKELHLNDYVPGKKMFHPPIHLGWGPLKRENLERYAEIVKRKGVEVIVLETALKNLDQLRQRQELLREESEYVRKIFGV